jgi:Aspartyl protease
VHRPTVRTPVPIVSATPFNYLHHLVTVPVVVGGEVETRFVLDTGIGLTLVSEEVGEAIGLTASGSHYTGRRMSGQDVSLPLATVGRCRSARSRRISTRSGSSTRGRLRRSCRRSAGFSRVLRRDAVHGRLSTRRGRPRDRGVARGARHGGHGGRRPSPSRRARPRSLPAVHRPESRTDRGRGRHG